jgi:hypothetical protein
MFTRHVRVRLYGNAIVAGSDSRKRSETSATVRLFSISSPPHNSFRICRSHLEMASGWLIDNWGLLGRIRVCIQVLRSCDGASIRYCDVS